MTEIDFLIDVGSPNAYFAAKVLPKQAAARGHSVRWRPVLLGGIFKATGNQSPMQAFGHIAPKMAYEMKEMERFVARHGLSEYTFNPHFPINTLLLMRAAMAAERSGDLEAYLTAALHHMWEAPKKMDDPQVAAAALSESGFDGPALVEAAGDPEIKAALLQSTEEAVARGVFGVPTFFVGDEMFFGKDRIEQVLEEADHKNQ